MSATDVLPTRAARASALTQVGAGPFLITVGLLLYPLVATPFFTFQIGAYTLILGLLGLSLMVLAGYGGMVSLAQITVAGVAGYALAILGLNKSGVLGLGWPWWLAVPIAIALGAAAGGLIGAIAVRSAGIYMIMITLAIATAFFFFVRQNYAVFNGFNGFSGVLPPALLGLNWRDPLPFYYLCLAIAALFYGGIAYAARSTFGLSLQAIRDNPRRMRALGYNVPAHRIIAFVLAGVIAATAGVLSVWFNGQISPGSIGVSTAIEVLIVAVVGGTGHPIGPFLGALLFVLLKNFAIDVIDRERFNTVIGLVFLAVVFVSPDGLLGLWARLKPHLNAAALTPALDQRTGGSHEHQ